MIRNLYAFVIAVCLVLLQIRSQPTASDSCVIFNSNYSVCTKCLPGLYLEYFFCIPCNPLCSCSNSSNYCQQCLNVTLNSRTLTSYRSGDVCELCNITIPFCLQCTSNLTCLKCMMGRYLQGGMCSNQTCTTNCQLCKNQTQCQVCAYGYFIDPNQPGTCSDKICAQNCYQCGTPTTCKICDSGFFADKNGVCQPCIGNCSICKNPNTCDVCLPSFIPSNGSCVSTGISNCIGYTGGAENPTCLVCEPGFYNAEGSCTQCSGCLLCTTSFLCQTPCLPGYQKFNYACIQSEAYIYVIYSTILLAMIFMH